jgi:hypothetical protein
VTVWVLPDTNPAPIVLVTDEPAVTDLFPELLREKSKDETLWVNQALASELGVILLLNPSAFTREVAVRVKGAVYCFEDCVGFVPSIV